MAEEPKIEIVCEHVLVSHQSFAKTSRGFSAVGELDILVTIDGVEYEASKHVKIALTKVCKTVCECGEPADPTKAGTSMVGWCGNCEYDEE